MNHLRDLTPQVLGALVRRYGDFASAEDAVQEALIAATETWPMTGEPEDQRAWLIRVASRRMANQFRAEDARRRREQLAAARWTTASDAGSDPVTGLDELTPDGDDTVLLMLWCCHPSLTPGASIPLTLRAVSGLTTAEIPT